MENKRRYPRYAESLEAAYEVGAGAAARLEQSSTVNISRGGCTLRMEGAERPGTRILVHLCLAGDEEVSILGTVVWVREAFGGQHGALGVAFDPEQALPPAFADLLGALERAST